MFDSNRKRWLALIVLCLGDLMIVLDTTIVNVALPSIREDLAFTETSLVWVVNAYFVTYGGFLLLGGRLGDLVGQRRVFIVGTTVFSIASLACGLAGSPVMLIAARAVQGAAGAKAMGIYGFISNGGATLGLLLGGTITTALGWPWVFLLNLPIGAVAC